MRIGILNADTVHPALAAVHGDYPAMFRRLLRDAAGARTSSAVRNPPEVCIYHVEGGRFPDAPGACDGWLITGSKCAVYDDAGWIRELAAFVRQAHDERRRLVGICFGHQIVARALGGEAGPAPGGWAVGVHENRLAGQRPWLPDPPARVAMISSHQDQVLELPAEAEPFATTAFCRHAGFTVGAHILTLQSHPEFARGYARALMDQRRDRLGPALYRTGIESLRRPLDSLRVGGWILDFLHQDGDAG